MTVTVNKDILLHPDFSQNLNEILCNYLNALIDEELEKEDADFDFIDECADAINSIRNGFVDAVIPVISRKDFMAKLGIRTVRFSKAFAAVIAAALMLVAANGIIASATDYNIIEEVSKKIVEFFTQEEEPPEPTTQPVTTTTAPPVTQESSTDESTTAVRKAEAITVEFSSQFKKEYNVGESFSPDGIQVFLIYDDGGREKIERKDYSLKVPSDFGKEAGYETVTVTFKDFESSFKVRILNTKETPLLTSVYATFPPGYEFKSDDLENIDLSRMRVFAVYSDESEKELTADEYTVKFEDNSTLFEKKVFVTVTYKTASCSFTVFKA
ncbi:MAG: bacterial Ig-like domain-containing protein [Clostridia bacterium]|nr:bacterial Ig-like domain-containing protein [Clostridia bacterium]